MLEKTRVGNRVGDFENVGVVGARVGRFVLVGFFVGTTGEAVGRMHFEEGTQIFPLHSHPLMESQSAGDEDAPHLFFRRGAM